MDSESVIQPVAGFAAPAGVGVRRRDVLNGMVGGKRVALVVALTVKASSVAWPQEGQNLAESGISASQPEQITPGILSSLVASRQSIYRFPISMIR